MLNFNSILVFSEDPKKLSEFYKKVFEKDPEWDMQGYIGFKAGAAFITFGPHDKVHGSSKEPERIMLNFESKDVKGEFERIKGIEGAKVIAEPYGDEEKPMEEGGGLVATFADLDGNFFQIMSPMPE
jgi:predicted enzyme related to lactoylglutathione lyase